MITSGSIPSGALALALLTATGVAAQESIAGGGGLELAVYETGNPEGRPIVFIHGFGQNHMAWDLQLDALDDEFRLVALDLRGHGASAQPLDAAHYTDGALWATDLAALIAAKQLDRPVLVGWSYGGFVIADYLRAHGDDALGGIVFVAAPAALGTPAAQRFFDPGVMQGLTNLMDPHVRTRIEASRAFLRAMPATPMSDERYEVSLASLMMIPPEVRRAVFSRQIDNDDVLSRITVPTLVIQGGADPIVLPATGRHIARIVPGAQLSVFEGVGHAPCFEDADRFNREIAQFVRGS